MAGRPEGGGTELSRLLLADNDPLHRALIALPNAAAQQFEPFLYGDYLWEQATNFVEMAGVKGLRVKRGG